MPTKQQPYLPTKEELLELGFKEDSIHDHIYYTMAFDHSCYGERCTLDVFISEDEPEYNLLFSYDEGGYVYPESKEDLKTLIRLLTPPTNANR